MGAWADWHRALVARRGVDHLEPSHQRPVPISPRARRQRPPEPARDHLVGRDLRQGVPRRMHLRHPQQGCTKLLRGTLRFRLSLSQDTVSSSCPSTARKCTNVGPFCQGTTTPVLFPQQPCRRYFPASRRSKPCPVLDALRAFLSRDPEARPAPRPGLREPTGEERPADREPAEPVHDRQRAFQHDSQGICRILL